MLTNNMQTLWDIMNGLEQDSRMKLEAYLLDHGFTKEEANIFIERNMKKFQEESEGLRK